MCLAVLRTKIGESFSTQALEQKPRTFLIFFLRPYRYLLNRTILNKCLKLNHFSLDTYRIYLSGTLGKFVEKPDWFATFIFWVQFSWYTWACLNKSVFGKVSGLWLFCENSILVKPDICVITTRIASGYEGLSAQSLLSVGNPTRSIASILNQPNKVVFKSHPPRFFLMG